MSSRWFFQFCTDLCTPCLMYSRSSGQLEPLVMPINFQNTQMVTVMHRTLKIIYRSLLVARAARTKCCRLLSFAHSILLRFAAQSINTARKVLKKSLIIRCKSAKISSQYQEVESRNIDKRVSYEVINPYICAIRK